jgi:hypothetical protein
MKCPSEDLVLHSETRSFATEPHDRTRNFASLQTVCGMSP